MRLNDWLSENSKNVSSALANSCQSSYAGNDILNYTTRAQVIGVLKELRSLLLPGVYDQTPVDSFALESRLHTKLVSVAGSLCGVISNALLHDCRKTKSQSECSKIAEDITVNVLEGLPGIKSAVSLDIQAAYEGDPAGKSFEEIILSYPSVEAVSIYRIAHLIFSLGVPIIPRIMTEYAHKNTGIDIHPGASIGKSFFIDHGTGVVIGETCTIGNNVKLYQGVTLGAKSFPLDEHGNPIKGIKRHPDIEDNVVIYAGATILGGDTRIGHDSVIGGNVWLTESVPPYSTVFNAQPSPVIKRK
jgi:serine O-acetyltransferase